MNLTEFAEQVVFGSTLEDKLLVPGKVTDAIRQGPHVDSLLTPGRPVGMQMQYGPGSNQQPPSDDRLENEQARGQLLHFLANHELLATELMALVLLKFPDAPAAFRQGILATLQEEQAHTRMYLRRMEECGVEFGSFPLSGQFWRVVEPMQSPLDFVARLSLTFEQANLDYSLHFAQVFARLGDQRTAAVLQKIYQDEIGHVRHGLHWFRQWKDPAHSDWEAYQASLDFPMSPERGRGPRGAFNRQGRRQAGLSEAFIDAIEVFRQSRGRAPTVWWFDPGAEAELARDTKAELARDTQAELARDTKAELARDTQAELARDTQAELAGEPALLDQLAQDLETVMVATTRRDDVLLVRRLPARGFSKQLLEAGFALPEFMLLDQRAKLADRKLSHFSPWAWTPENCRLVEPLAAHQGPPAWNEQQRELFRKSWATERLQRWLDQDTPEGFVQADCVGLPVRCLAEVEPALRALASRGFTVALVKHDLAAAGRGQRRLDCKQPLSRQDRRWLERMFALGTAGLPAGVVEPELERVLDVSLLWHLPVGAQRPNFLGWTRAQVTADRRYAGTYLGNALADCDAALRRWVLEERCGRIRAAAAWLEPRLTAELVARNFSGYFGVDAMVVQRADESLALKPLGELNPRMTMGHVALELEQRLAPGVHGAFRIFTAAQWQRVEAPLASVALETGRGGQWKSGVIQLSEVDAQTKLVPVVLVGPEALRAADLQ